MMRLRSILRCLWIVWSVWIVLATQHRVEVFQTDHSLWADAVQKAPFKPRPWINYAHELEKAGHYPEALVGFLYASDLASRRVNQYPTIASVAQAGVIRVLLAQGRLEEADKYMAQVPKHLRNTYIMGISRMALQMVHGRCTKLVEAGRNILQCKDTLE